MTCISEWFFTPSNACSPTMAGNLFHCSTTPSLMKCLLTLLLFLYLQNECMNWIAGILVVYYSASSVDHLCINSPSVQLCRCSFWLQKAPRNHYCVLCYPILPHRKRLPFNDSLDAHISDISSSAAASCCQYFRRLLTVRNWIFLFCCRHRLLQQRDEVHGLHVVCFAAPQ